MTQIIFVAQANHLGAPRQKRRDFTDGLRTGDCNLRS
jgi:hypothetical protein